MTSLPVPLSPVNRMETSLGATRSTVRTTDFIPALWKTGEAPPVMVESAWRSELASSLSALCSSARLGPFERGLRGSGAFGGNNIITLRLQQRDHQIAHVDIVVDHHDSRFHTGHFNFGLPARIKLRNISQKTSCSSNKRSGWN